MELLIRFSLAVLVIFMIRAGQQTEAKDQRDLLISAVRFDNESDALQLLIVWDTSAAEPDKILYEVKVHHIPSEKCIMEHGKFANHQDIACAPIVAETEDTSIRLPRDPSGVDKHVCFILPYCSYRVTVNALDFFWRLSQTFDVPECVHHICSCYYDHQLPNITTSVNIFENLLIVNWILQRKDNTTEIPSDVELEQVEIKVRRGKNENLIWGGQESSKMVVHLPADDNGSHTFDVRDFEGDKAIFVAQVRLYDNRRCYSEAIPQIAYFRNAIEKHKPPSDKTVWIPTSTIVQVFVPVCVITLIGGIMYQMLIKKKRKPRRMVTNWRNGHDVSSPEDLKESIQMEENHLYTDWEVIEARARGEADSLEVPHSTLRIGREIGKGAFGRVFLAHANKIPGCNGPMVVAVKQLKKCSKQVPEFEEFLDEIAMMKQVGRHPNIVTLLGCCTIKEPLTMIMEYVGCGDLLEYLRKIRSKHLARVAQLEAVVTHKMTDVSLKKTGSNQSGNTVLNSMLKYMEVLHASSSTSDTSYITQPDTILSPSLTDTMYTTLSGNNERSSSFRELASIEYVLDHKELHHFARQIACGMQHLEEKQITHRDLAARNILIDERKILKISDFGLSRTGIYVNTKNKKVPLRWLSIEAIRDNLYSSKSDVWAFGVVLWEIGTLGGYPYPTVSNHELLSYLFKGSRLERPENCSTELYELMLNCWKSEPDHRPSFKEIYKSLEPHRRIYIDFNEIEPTYVFPPTAEQIIQDMPSNRA